MCAEKTKDPRYVSNCIMLGTENLLSFGGQYGSVNTLGQACLQ